VRSVLDHAWAEVEHELVYKSGAQFPAEFERRFAAVAGAFEILEREFVSLREAADALIDKYVGEFAAGRHKSVQLDGASLSAALDCLQPHGRTWRQDGRSGAQYPPITTVKAALEAVGITTYANLAAAVRTQGVRAKLEAFASLVGTTPDEVSHLAVCSVILGVKDHGILDLYLPDVAESQPFLDLFDRRGQTNPS